MVQATAIEETRSRPRQKCALKKAHRNGVQALSDPTVAAAAAGLHYVMDDMPGIRRVRAGARFRYVGVDGKTIHSSAIVQRLKALAIPPAWRQVWICPSPSGHLQATGLDARGRKQYRYHARWRQVRDETKFFRMAAFGRALPRIRARVRKDLARPGLTRRKVLAAIVRLLERTHIRVGNDEYARANHSFGLTTLRDHHVRVKGSTVSFFFRGKGGIRHALDLNDRRLARIIKQCQDIPGHELFQYQDEAGAQHRITSTDVNDYLHEIAGQEFTAKDFRTWAGTVLAIRALQEFATFASQRQAKHNVVEAVAEVARRLGNTRAVCRKCYIHPAVLEAYMEGCLVLAQPEQVRSDSPPAGSKLSAEEEAVLALLRGRHQPLQKSG